MPKAITPITSAVEYPSLSVSFQFVQLRDVSAGNMVLSFILIQNRQYVGEEGISAQSLINYFKGQNATGEVVRTIHSMLAHVQLSPCRPLTREG